MALSRNILRVKVLVSAIYAVTPCVISCTGGHIPPHATAVPAFPDSLKLTSAQLQEALNEVGPGLDQAAIQKIERKIAILQAEEALHHLVAGSKQDNDDGK